MFEVNATKNCVVYSKDSFVLDMTRSFLYKIREIFKHER